MTLNTNQIVKVKLTTRGKLYSKNGYESERLEDSYGYTRWTLWRLMKVFGGAVVPGCDPIFENNEIILDLK